MNAARTVAATFTSLTAPQIQTLLANPGARGAYLSGLARVYDLLSEYTAQPVKRSLYDALETPQEFDGRAKELAQIAGDIDYSIQVTMEDNHAAATELKRQCDTSKSPGRGAEFRNATAFMGRLLAEYQRLR